MNIREAKQIKVNNYIGSWSIIDDNGKRLYVPTYKSITLL